MNEHAVTFYRNKMYHIFGHGHYDILILKQNNLFIIKVFYFSNLLLEKLANSPKSCYE